MNHIRKEPRIRTLINTKGEDEMGIKMIESLHASIFGVELEEPYKTQDEIRNKITAENIYDFCKNKTDEDWCVYIGSAGSHGNINVRFPTPSEASDVEKIINLLNELSIKYYKMEK